MTSISFVAMARLYGGAQVESYCLDQVYEKGGNSNSMVRLLGLKCEWFNLTMATTNKLRSYCLEL